jgi:hypothetical protein
MVAGVEPAMVGVAKTVEGADVDHDADLGTRETPSSVSHVTTALVVKFTSFMFVRGVSIAISLCLPKFATAQL